MLSPRKNSRNIAKAGKAAPEEGMAELEELRHSPADDADSSSEPTTPSAVDSSEETAPEPTEGSPSGSESASDSDEAAEVSS